MTICTAPQPSTTENQWHIWQRLAVSCHLDDSALANLQTQALPSEGTRGAVLWTSVDGLAPLGVVAHGAVGLYRCSSSGQDVMVDCMSSGDAFGLVPVDVRALVQDTLVFFVPQSRLRPLLRLYPQLHAAIHGVQHRHLRRAYRQIERLAWADTKTRLARVLVDLARAHPNRVVSATHGELAAMVATRQDEVTKTLRRFRANGIISTTPYRNGLVVRDMDALAALA